MSIGTFETTFFFGAVGDVGGDGTSSDFPVGVRKESGDLGEAETLWEGNKTLEVGGTVFTRFELEDDEHGVERKDRFRRNMMGRWVILSEQPILSAGRGPYRGHKIIKNRDVSTSGRGRKCG